MGSRQVCWIPVLKAKKLILAGDPMQLPPTIISIDKPRKDKKQPKPQASNTKSTKTNPKALSVASPKVEETIPNDTDAEASESESDSEESEEDELQPNAPSPTVDEKITEKAKSKPKKKETRRGILRPPRTLETTMFDRLEKMYGPSIKRMLTVQYR